MAKIALFFTALKVGGTERQALNLIEGIKKKHDIIIYAILDGPMRKDLEKEFTVRITGKKNPFSLISTVRGWIKEDDIDILHCLLWHPNMIGRFAAIGTGAKVINSVRWAEWRMRDWADYFSRFLVDAWIANSKHGARISKLPSRKTRIINNGLQKQILDSTMKTWKPRRKTVGMIGHFRREKRFDVLIEAARLLPDFTFELIGDGDTFEEMEELAKDLQNVNFHGSVPDAGTLAPRWEMAVLLSEHEGSPNVALEAMGHGVPFIGSDIDAHREILADGRGILVPVGDYNAVGRAIVEMHRMDKKKRDAMRMRAMEYVHDNYTKRKLIQETMKLYEELLDK